MWRRPTALLSVVVVSASCSAIGVGTSDGSQTELTSSERHIDRSEFRLQWPFTVGSVVLACDAGAILVRDGETTYGLNEAALVRGFRPATPILLQRHAPASNPLRRLPQRDRERIFSAVMTCDDAGQQTACRSGMLRQFRLSDDELEQVLVEGRERHWSPLPPERMSVEPIVKAGSTLCR